MHKAFQYLDEHLADAPDLAKVAEVACYSEFHFHRVFKAMTGHTLKQYLTQRRMALAADALLHREDLIISELALRLGYSSPAVFNRAFKKFYGMSPSAFRREAPSKFSKIRKSHDKNGQVITEFEAYVCRIETYLNYITMNATVEVATVPAMQIAYLSHTGLGPEMATTFEKLTRWAELKGLMGPDTQMLSVYHDSPKMVGPENVRVSAGIVLDTPLEAEGEIGMMQLEPGSCIKARFELGMGEFENAWVSMFVWMNEKGYRPSAQPPFEIYYNDAREHPQHKFIVDLFVPIE